MKTGLLLAERSGAPLFVLSCGIRQPETPFSPVVQSSYHTILAVVLVSVAAMTNYHKVSGLQEHRLVYL